MQYSDLEIIQEFTDFDLDGNGSTYVIAKKKDKSTLAWMEHNNRVLEKLKNKSKIKNIR